VTDPIVCAVMVTRYRPGRALRAIRAFLAQTYTRSRLLVWDTTPRVRAEQGDLAALRVSDLIQENERVWIPDVDPGAFLGRTIGYARNAANKYAADHYMAHGTEAQILMHWDDDDWSHPQRIAEQVEMLQRLAPAVECVGYRDLLFFDTRGPTYVDDASNLAVRPRNEAWRFTHKHPGYVVGASMAYWVDTWRSKPFRDQPAEDGDWWRRYTSICAGASAFEHPAPRMVCEIHGANTESYDRARMAMAEEYMRSPSYDQYCRQVLAERCWPDE
jgi:hypothetical protein